MRRSLSVFLWSVILSRLWEWRQMIAEPSHGVIFNVGKGRGLMLTADVGEPLLFEIVWYLGAAISTGGDSLQRFDALLLSERMAN